MVCTVQIQKTKSETSLFLAWTFKIHRHRHIYTRREKIW